MSLIPKRPPHPASNEEKAMFTAAVLRRENELLRQLIAAILENAVVANPNGERLDEHT
jgi:hypothetical protein